MREKAGYSWLIEQYQLPVIGLWQHCYIDSATKGRQSQDLGEHQVQLFAPNYQPPAEASAHLQFALRYEGLNLQALSLLFDQLPPGVLCDWILQNPTSAYARRGCFLYEWITGLLLPVDDPVPPKAKYVDIVDPEQEFTSGRGAKVPRFRVNNNLPGTPAFCPMVRKTDKLKTMVNKDLRHRTRKALARYDQDLLRRAAAFLYLKETQSSFEVEREMPSPDRAQRFADLLRQADTGESLTEQRLLELQNAIIDPRFHEFGWRHQQNWIGEDLGYRQRVEFVPARPEDLQGLMQGLLDTAAKARAAGLEDDTGALPFDPVVYAAVIAFGFVFIHPFMDGNGRIHRYLIHEVLANAGFTPRGIVLPVSAVILANLDEYVAVLQAFSGPLRARTQYTPATPELPATGNDAVYFRFFDATPQAEFLYRALERTLEEDLQQEIDFLLGFDKARKELNNLLDWPRHDLDLFIRVVHQNGGELSANKRKSHFNWMREEEISEAQIIVAQAFANLPGRKTADPGDSKR
ncbi:Fic family protein [Parahaliea mediterranea]|uniref:Fic family protein n=1 Tax=Parahaliea mediterranea TaxID=651086 RepID=A0A939INB0_9GAMM|nr:Fic family protein [Parahaliea mediterranea]MBN7797867.1 Fic family protein [Parahaliea mediterranea]